MPKSGQEWDNSFLLGHPLFHVFEPLAAHLRVAQFPTVEQLTDLAEAQRALRAPEQSKLRFTPADKKPRRKKRTELVLEQLYDGSISLKGEVPCLVQSYHDLFNALAFAAFIRSKRTLHHRQFVALRSWAGDRAQLPGKRTREQDALTIFDEGGVIVLMDKSFSAAWRCSTGATPIPAFAPESGVVPLLFGHALLEHILYGHVQIRASAIVIDLPHALSPEIDLLEVSDLYLSQRLADPLEFSEPGADVIFKMDGDLLSIGPPKPAWSAWTPGDKEAFTSCYRAKLGDACINEHNRNNRSEQERGGTDR